MGVMLASVHAFDFRAAEVAAVCEGLESLFAHRCLGRGPHFGQLCSIVTDVGYLMGHDQVMPRVDRGLDVVTDHSTALGLGDHGTRVRVGQ